MLAVLRALLAGLFDIALFRRGPDVLPTSTTLLGIIIASHVAINAFFLSRTAEAAAFWPIALALQEAFTLGWYFVTLKRAGKPERFTQTMTAMYGIDVLFRPIIMPLALAFMSQPKGEQAAAAGALAIFVLAVCVWVLAINVHIVRAALEWPILRSLGLFLAQNVAWFVIATLLFGVTASPPG